MRTVVVALLFVATPAFAGSSYEGRARSEVSECLQDARMPAWEIVAQTEVISACFAGGFITEVDYWSTYRCHPGQVCPKVRALNVATVTFGCDDEIIDGVCWADVKPEPEEPAYCTEEYAPVCGTDGVTYSNGCFADLAGATVDYRGECADTIMCPMYYAPVCGTDGKTYSNTCFAGVAGATVAYEGECPEVVVE